MKTSKRKDEHMDICANLDVDRKGSCFDRYVFEHNALPEINMTDIDTSVEFLGKKLALPLIITSMVGGTDKAAAINKNLALVAQKTGVAMGVGSQRIVLEDAESLGSFEVRQCAKDVLLLANLGAVQLNYGYGVADCAELVKSIGADALCLHLNPLQEALQPEGDTDFSGLLAKISEVVANLNVPVIVKEVGAGISGVVAQKLFNAGVRYIDVAGRGGTSWAYIEGKRRNDSLGEVFADWGICTPKALEECTQVRGLTLIAGGGVRTGLDMAKALALGATCVSMGLPFLRAAEDSAEAVCQLIERLTFEFKVAMFATGSANVAELREKPLSESVQIL